MFMCNVYLYFLESSLYSSFCFRFIDVFMSLLRKGLGVNFVNLNNEH